MEIKQIMITQIGTKPYTTKAGKQIQKVGLQCEQYGDEWLTKFVWEKDDPCLTWKAGDMVEVVVKQNGQYFNFNVPTRVDRLEMRLEKLEYIVRKQKNRPTTSANEPSLGDEDNMANPEDAFDPENTDLPF